MQDRTSAQGVSDEPCAFDEHWFTGLLQARTVIETWRREYDEERPKKALGGPTPADYAKQLATQLS